MLIEYLLFLPVCAFSYRKLQHSKILSSETQKDMPSWNWHLLADPFSLVEIRNELTIMVFFTDVVAEQGHKGMRRFSCWRHQFLLQMWPFLCSSFVPPTRALWLIRIFLSALRRAPSSELLCDARFGLEFSIFWQASLKWDLCFFFKPKGRVALFWHFLYCVDEAGWCVKAKLPSHPYRSSIQAYTAAGENLNYCILQANEGGLFAHDKLKTWLLEETSVDNCL